MEGNRGTPLRLITLTLTILLPSAPLVTRAQADSSPSLVSVTGHVRDTAGQPVAGAQVRITASGRMAVADADGSIELQDIPAGRQMIEVYWPGYAPIIREVIVSADTPLELSLTPTPFLIPGVTVTATRAPANPLFTPLPADELGGSQLRHQEGVSLARSLEVLPGLRDLSTGQEIGKPVIRGLAGSRVLVLEDGNRLEDYSWSEEDGPSVDTRLAERVEVIRGPASLLYGSDALGGVVNVIPGDLLQTNEAEGMTRVGYGAYAASNNKEFGGMLRVEGSSDRLGWRLYGVGRKSEALHTPDGELENTGFFSVNGEGALKIRGSHHSGQLRVAHYGGEFHLLEANGPPPGTVGGEEEGPVRKTDDERVQLSGDHHLGEWWFETRAQYQRHVLQEVSDEAIGVQPAGAAIARASAAAAESTAFDLLLNTISAEVVAHRPVGEKGSALFGLTGLLQENDTRGPIPLVPDANMSTLGAFTVGELTVGKLDFLAGARVDDLHGRTDPNAGLSHAGDERDFTSVSADVGIVARASSELAISANVGRAWRAPNLFELYSNGPHLAENRYEIGMASLKQESGLNTDAGIRWEHARFRGEVTGFANWITDFIYITPTGEAIDGLQVYRHTQADAILAGGEVAAEVAAGDHLTLKSSLDYVWGSKEEPDHPPLPQIPPARGVVAAMAHTSTLGWADQASLELLAEIHGEQTRRTEFDHATDGYTLLNLNAGLKRSLAGRAYDFDLSIRNLLNTRYRDYLSRYNEFALDPGINIIMRISTGL